MGQDTFVDQVRVLRRQGTSIRAIAAKLNVHHSRVQRAVARLSAPLSDPIDYKASYQSHKSPFVGRESELAVLRQALRDVMAGGGKLVLLGGEPGIGKTRLAEELDSYAQLQQVPVYWGRCHEESPAMPLWPWVQVMRVYISRHRALRLRSDMGAGVADIAGIVPEICQKLPEVAPARPLNDPSEDRFRLFDSMSNFFQTSSRRQPMLVILDNLQWADTTSLVFLEFLAQELAASRLLVIGIYRSVGLARGHPLSGTLGVLSREPSFPHVALHGLSQDEVGRLVRARAGIEPSPEIVEVLYRRSEGNPLFVVHIARSLAEDRSLIGQTGRTIPPSEVGVPDSLQAAIRRNLAHLSPRCQEVMSAASVAIRRFTGPQLQRIAEGVPPHELSDLLDEAIRGGVIAEATPETGAYQFTHVLVKETLLSGLSSTQSANLHARMGQALEREYDQDVADHAAELAYHFAMSADLTGTARAIHYSLAAGERALTMFSYDQAELHFDRALEMKQKQTPAALHGIPDDETAEILLGVVKAKAAILSYGGSHKPSEILGQLIDYHLGRKDIARTIELARLPLFISDNVSLTASRTRFERALGMVEADSRDAGWLLCFYGYFLGTYGGDYTRSQEAFDRALAIARRYGDREMEMRALINSVQTKGMYWKTDWHGALRAISIAELTGDRQVEMAGRFFACVFATTTRTHAEATGHWERAISLAGQLRYRSWLDSLTAMGQLVAHYYGDFQISRIRGARGVRGPESNLLSMVIRALTEYELGEIEQGDEFVEQAVESLEQAAAGPFTEYGWPAAQLPYINFLTARERWTEMADRLINVILATCPQDNFFSIMAHIGIGLRAVNAGDVPTANRSYEYLKGPLKSDPIRCMITPIAMSSDRLLGLLCLSFGDVEQAVVHFEDAVSLCRDKGYLPELAWSAYDLARALLQRKGPGDRKTAVELTADALSVAEKLEMRLLADRIRLVPEFNRARRPHSDDPHHFTRREIEVLKLLAVGKTNREIALELKISLNTALTHVRNILSKGNLANRTEAAAYVARHYPPEN